MGRHDPRGILEQYADIRGVPTPEAKPNAASKAAGIPASVAPKPYDIIAEHADDPAATTLLAVGHGSWIVATVAVLLDAGSGRPQQSQAMRNAFWTSMSVSTGGSNGPADPRHMAVGSTPSAKVPPSPRLPIGRMGREEVRG